MNSWIGRFVFAPVPYTLAAQLFLYNQCCLHLLLRSALSSLFSSQWGSSITICGLWIRGWKNATDCEIAWFLSGMLVSSCAQSSALISGLERGLGKEGRCLCVFLSPCMCVCVCERECCVHANVGKVLNGCVYAWSFRRLVIPDKLSQCCPKIGGATGMQDSVDDCGDSLAFSVSVGKGQ